MMTGWLKPNSTKVRYLCFLSKAMVCPSMSPRHEPTDSTCTLIHRRDREAMTSELQTGVGVNGQSASGEIIQEKLFINLACRTEASEISDNES